MHCLPDIRSLGEVRGGYGILVRRCVCGGGGGTVSLKVGIPFLNHSPCLPGLSNPQFPLAAYCVLSLNKEGVLLRNVNASLVLSDHFPAGGILELGNRSGKE